VEDVEDDESENEMEVSDEDPAVDAIEVAVKGSLDELVDDLRHKTGKKVGIVECKGSLINNEDTQRRKCTCLSLYNEDDENEKQQRLDILVTAVATWVRKGTFKVNGYLDLRTMSERETHLRESIFCCFSTSKLLCTVDLTNLFGKKKWHVHLQTAKDKFLCLSTFLRLFSKIEQKMVEISESLIDVGGYNENSNALDQLKEEGTRRFTKQHNASLLMAFAKMAMRKERKKYDEISDQAGEVRVLEGRKNAYDYQAIEKIARLYMEGLNPEKEDLTSVIDTYRDGGRKNMTKEEKNERTRARRSSQMMLINRGLYNDTKAIVILIPGTEAADAFLRMFHNGNGKMADQPRARLFQIEDEPLDWVMNGMFVKATTSLKNKESLWQSAKNTNGRLRYLATDGGLFNGFKKYEEQIIGNEWEEKIMKVDKYLHDLLEDTIAGEDVNATGLEKNSDRETRWINAKKWVDQEVMKNKSNEDSWWSQERKEWHLWIDFGFLYTEMHGYQDAHYDYQRMKDMHENWLAFMGLTDSGMFLQVWPERPSMPDRYDNKTRNGKSKLKNALNQYEKKQGHIVFLPKGVGLAVGGDVCHSGSILCEPCKEYESYANPRFHCYIREKKWDEITSKEKKYVAATRGATYSNCVGIGEAKGNRWKEYDSECGEEDYTSRDADAAMRKDMVLCRELRITNERCVRRYTDKGGNEREKLDDTIFG
jgi:hypothetical protein